MPFGMDLMQGRKIRMKCRKCGAEYGEDVKFCTKCGASM
ncbi:MAG: zinc ribbon domain-containing protein, partial [Clostridiales bacterium]|nr:zinc ribbon domain-containing protein [Clostridiales bacterium]